MCTRGWIQNNLRDCGKIWLEMTRPSVRFEDEKDFKKEICLKVFSRFLKKDNPESFILHFFSRKVNTVIFINGA